MWISFPALFSGIIIVNCKHGVKVLCDIVYGGLVGSAADTAKQRVGFFVSYQFIQTDGINRCFT